MTEQVEKKPSWLLVWAAKKFAGLDDKQMALLPDDRWVFKNFREAIGETEKGDVVLDRILSGALLTGSVLAGGVVAAVVAAAAFPALVLSGIALLAAGLTSAVTWKNVKEMRRDILPAAGKNMGKRFLKYQGDKIKGGWKQKLEEVKAKRKENPQGALPKTELTGVFKKLFKPKQAVANDPAPVVPATKDKGAKP